METDTQNVQFATQNSGIDIHTIFFCLKMLLYNTFKVEFFPMFMVTQTEQMISFVQSFDIYLSCICSHYDG